MNSSFGQWLLFNFRRISFSNYAHLLFALSSDCPEMQLSFSAGVQLTFYPGDPSFRPPTNQSATEDNPLISAQRLCLRFQFMNWTWWQVGATPHGGGKAYLCSYQKWKCYPNCIYSGGDRFWCGSFILSCLPIDFSDTYYTGPLLKSID